MYWPGKTQLYNSFDKQVMSRTSEYNAEDNVAESADSNDGFNLLVSPDGHQVPSVSWYSITGTYLTFI